MRNILKTLTFPELADLTPTLLVNLDVLGNWIRTNNRVFVLNIDKTLQESLLSLNSIFGSPKIFSPQHLCLTGIQLRPFYPYQGQEKLKLKFSSGYHTTYSFEVCTFLARHLDYQKYLIVRLVNPLPSLLTTNQLKTVLSYIVELLVLQTEEFSMYDYPEISKLYKKVLEILEVVNRYTNLPEGWTYLESESVVVVSFFNR